MDDGVDDDDVVNRDGEHTRRRTRLETMSRMLNAVSLRCQYELNYSLVLESEFHLEIDVSSIYPHMTVFEVLEVDDLLQRDLWKVFGSEESLFLTNTKKGP